MYCRLSNKSNITRDEKLRGQILICVTNLDSTARMRCSRRGVNRLSMTTTYKEESGMKIITNLISNLAYGISGKYLVHCIGIEVN